VDARIIATSNRDVVAAVKKSEFREDLYYRLNVIKLVIPPLRERPKDVVALAQYFLDKYREEYKRPGLVLSDDAILKLKKYSWPGNVRELQNVIQRAILMSQGTIIMPNDVPVNTKINVRESLDWVEALPLGRPMREVETHFIIETLKYHNGNRTHAAKTLGISLRTLRNKINEFTASGYEVPAPTIGKAL
jgi:transcriptional regulator with PAS, ATPase and Fis domain